MTSFKSSTKVKGVNIGSDPVAVMVALYQQMIDSRFSPNKMNQMKDSVQVMGFDPDAMNINGDFEQSKKKRAKANNGTGTFSNNSSNFEFPISELMYFHKFNWPTVHYKIALRIPSNLILAVDKTTNSFTSVVTHTLSLAAVAAAATVLNK